MHTAGNSFDNLLFHLLRNIKLIKWNIGGKLVQIIDVDNFSTEFRTAREENKHDVPDCATILHKKRSPNKRSKQAHHELDESRRVNKVQSF